jgi:acetoin utilization protein AcuB
VPASASQFNKEKVMIVREVMTTALVVVTPDDLLSHAASLLRQHQFHHLPVVKTSSTTRSWSTNQPAHNSKLILEGLLTSQDIDVAIAIDAQSSGDVPHQPWQEQRVGEVMHPASITITPTTSVAAAVQILVERGINCIPVVNYEESDKKEQAPQDAQPLLVGLVTRSDMLMALARTLGAFEPGMQLRIALPEGDMTPLTNLLLLSAELHIKVHSVLAGPLEGSFPRSATVRLGTINPIPLLLRLQKANISYSLDDMPVEATSSGKNEAG